MDSNDNIWRRILGFSPALFAALTGITVTVIAYTLAVQLVEYCVYSRFERAAMDHAASVQRSLSEVRNALDNLQDFYLASISVERHEFERFAQGILERIPGITAVAWAPRVAAKERAATIAAARAFDPEFKIYNESAVDDEAELYPLLYLQPPHRTEARPGLNLASLPEIRPLLSGARDSGHIFASPRIGSESVKGATDPYRVVLLTAVYRGDVPLWSTQQRRQNLTGFLVLQVTIADLVENALAQLQ